MDYGHLTQFSAFIYTILGYFRKGFVVPYFNLVNKRKSFCYTPFPCRVIAPFRIIKINLSTRILMMWLLKFL